MASPYLDLVKDLFGKAFSISRWYIPGHDGIDLPAKTGTPIRAVASGTVSYARDARTDSKAGSAWAIGGGNVVNINIGDNLTTQYAHLDRIYVKSGQYVRKGDIIGTVGSTGGTPNSPTANFGASGAHLHFGLWDRKANKMIDPTAFLLAARAGWNTSDGPGRDDWAMRPGEQALGGWGNLVQLPEGHIITAADVDSIMDILSANGFFDAGAPGFVAKNVTRSILMQYVGKPWNKATQDAIQAHFNEAAQEAGDPVTSVFGPVIGGLTDPGFWVRVLALGAGVAIFGFGAVNVLRAGGAPRVAV